MGNGFLICLLWLDSFLFVAYSLLLQQLSYRLFNDALALLSSTLTVSDVENFPVDLTCEGSGHWTNGNRLIQRMRQVRN